VPVGQFMKEGVKTVDPRSTPDEMFELWSIPAFDAGRPELLRGGEIGSQKKVVSPGDVLLSRIIPHIRRGWVVRENSDGRRQIASTEWIVFSSAEVVPGFLRQLLVSDFFHVSFMQTITGVGGSLSRANPGAVGEIKIPVPPLEVQKEIVAEIESYQKVINGARAVLDHYRPHIPIHPDWPMVELGEITKPEYGFTEKAAEKGDARFVRITDISEDGKLRAEDPRFITLTKDARQSLLSNGDILVARTGATYGKTMIFEETYPAVFASFLIRLRFPKDRVHPRYYWVFAQSDLYLNQASALMTGGGQPQFNGNALVQVKIPLPPLATQQAVVAEIEAEQALVAANRELITRFEKKIQSTLARIWGEERPPTPAS
jgi:type I restriction enzyme M protein